MTDLVITLLGGVLAIAIGFVLLYRFSRLGGKGTALITALLVLGIYLPIVILDWPGADVFAIHIAIYLVTVYVLGIITSQRDARLQQGEVQGWFHWGPAALIVFFAVIIAVDSIFIFMAQKGVDSQITRWLLPEPRGGGKVTSHFPGTVARDYRKKEDEFNEYQQRMQEQQQRNWQIKKGWLGEAYSGRPATFKLSIADEQGEPIRYARIAGRFMRPANSKLDQAFQMEAVAGEPGSYTGVVTLPEPGNWELLLQIQVNEILHEISARTTVDAGD